MIRGVIRVVGSPASAWTVRLLSPEEGKALREARIAPDAGRERSSTFRLASVPPGPYVLEVLSEEESWSCRTDLGFQDAGVRNVHALYRSPSWLSGRVVDGAGEPIGSVPVTLAPVDGEREAGSSGPWHCGPADLREDHSDAAGRFRVPFDPGSSHVIVAGGLTDRRGIAAAFLTEPTSRELMLHDASE